MHSDLKVSAAAVDDESSQDNEKHNCGGDRPPVIFAPLWVGPPTIVARATSAFKVFVYHIPARLARSANCPRRQFSRLGAATGLGPASKAVVGGRPPKPKADREPSRVLAHHVINCTFGCILLRIKFCMHPLITFCVYPPAIACNCIRFLRVSSGRRPAVLVSFRRTSRTEYLKKCSVCLALRA